MAQTGFDEVWMTLLLATAPPRRSRTCRLRTCGRASSMSPITSTTTSRARQPRQPLRRPHRVPPPAAAVVRLAAELIDGRAPAGETTVERLRAIGALTCYR